MSKLSPEDEILLRERLKLEPRHVRRVVCRTEMGEPAVIEYYPLVLSESGEVLRPYPTLYWLVGRKLDVSISRLEFHGWIRRLQERILSDAEFREAQHAAHREYIERRWDVLREEHRAIVLERGWGDVFRHRGIGAIADWDRVKCLHLHYAHHCAGTNPVGAAVAELLAAGEGET